MCQTIIANIVQIDENGLWENLGEQNRYNKNISKLMLIVQKKIKKLIFYFHIFKFI